MRGRTAVAVAVMAAGVAAPAAAQAAGPEWRAGGPAGWETVGAQVPYLAESAAVGGAMLAVTGADGLLRVADAGGSTAVRRSPTRYPGERGLAFVGSRLLAAAGCAVARTDDAGRTWARSPLPGCRRQRPTDRRPSLRALDGRSALAADGTRTWRTGDAGDTWTATAESERSGLPVTPDVRFRVETTADGSKAVVERTVDAGRTWRALTLPDVLGSSGARVPLRDLGGAVTLAVRPGGTLLIAAGRSLLSSSDAGATFAVRDLPADPTPPSPAAAGDDGRIEGVVCDPAGACVVGVGRGSAPRYGRVFSGDAFGAVVAAPPERAPDAPAPGVIVGLEYVGGGEYKTGPMRWRLVRTDDLGATPYRSASEWYGGRFVLGTDGVLSSFPASGVLRSLDGGSSFSVPGVPGPDPAGGALVATAAGPVGLAADGGLWRFVDGAWAPKGRIPVDDESVLADAGGGDVLVVGSRRIQRFTAEDGIEPLRHPAPGPTVGPVAVDGRGGTVVLRGTRSTGDGGRQTAFAYRSSDGGRRWTRVRRGPAVRYGTTGIRFVDRRVGFALRGDALERTTDGGRTFRRIALVPDLDGDHEAGPDDEPLDTGAFDLRFADRRRGLVMTTAGLLRTTDGGRRWTPLPAPRDETPTTARLQGGRLVLTTDAADGAWRTSMRGWRGGPTVSLGRLLRHRSGGPRVVRARGALRGAPAGAHVVLAAARTDGRTVALRRVAVVGGRFSANVRVPRRSSGVQAWYLGSVGRTGTTPGASSRTARLP